MEAIVSTYAGDADLVPIVMEFVSCLPERIRAMRNDLSSGSFADLERLAHQLKGAGGSYGYACLTDAARELESYAKGEDAEAAMLALNTLTHICERVQAGHEMNSVSQDARKT